MRDDGGPAFPGTDLDRQKDPMKSAAFGGMSLRDYFAAKALELLIRAEENRAPFSDITDQIRARRAYELADAMLKERDK